MTADIVRPEGRRKQVFMRDWREKLDSFLRFNERAVLASPGKVSREEADRLAHEHYASFRQRRIEAAQQEGEDAMLKAVEAALGQRTATKKGKNA